MTFWAMGSGWWSVGGIALDLFGFLILAIDLVPQYRLNRARFRVQSAARIHDTDFEALATTLHSNGVKPLRTAFISALPIEALLFWRFSRASRLETFRSIIRKWSARLGVGPSDPKLVEALSGDKKASEILLIAQIARITALINVKRTIRLLGRRFNVIDRQSVSEGLHAPGDPKRLHAALEVLDNEIASQAKLQEWRSRPPLFLGISAILAGFLLQLWGAIPITP